MVSGRVAGLGQVSGHGVPERLGVADGPGAEARRRASPRQFRGHLGVRVGDQPGDVTDGVPKADTVGGEDADRIAMVAAEMLRPERAQVIGQHNMPHASFVEASQFAAGDGV